MSVARHHAEWLSLVETSGPFLSMPVLLRVFPQGLDSRDAQQAARLREVYEDWLERGATLPSVHQAWIRYVLHELLGYPKGWLTEGQTIPPGIEAVMDNFGEVLRPDIVLKRADDEKPVLLVALYPPDQDLEKPVSGKLWKATAGTRIMELLHAADLPLGLITNGEEWTLVSAPRGETTGFASWYADLWMQEPLTLRAFHSLLHLRRLVGVAEPDTLPALFIESSKDQQEVTDQLGYQVRQAVEVLVQAFDRIDAESGRALLSGINEKALYDSALTVMMRLVFLFSAEERGLLLLGDPLYDQNYALSTLSALLREQADQHGEEVLERRHDAWCRLLSTFRAVHGGVEHEAMRLPAYGGRLFDPDRYSFLEGRAGDTSWLNSPASPLLINNRVVLHLLEALQLLRVKVPGGGPAEARRLSFRSLDIEQIGHVYEGLLDHTAKRAIEPVLGLAGSKDKEPEIPLVRLEEAAQRGTVALVEFLRDETGRSERALKRLIEESPASDDHALLLACGQDERLARRVKPFAPFLREDSFGELVVVPPGSVYVTVGSDRRSTGTHYTPRLLTEPIVRYALEPLVYVGPVEGLPQSEWTLKSPREILAFKICDMAMGSGAFLVETCRYLAERLVEAWENAEREHPGAFVVTPDGELSIGASTERLIPADSAERVAVARRFVADRCLYGVDINPMAVEMAKLSLWLITLQRDRPFSFLDHALKCGDSLLGVRSLKQIENFSFRTDVRQITFATAELMRHVDEASAKRRALEDLPSNDHAQIETKNALHGEAELATAQVKALADCLVAFELRGLTGEEYEEQRTLVADSANMALRKPLTEFKAYAREQLNGHRPFHWAIEFPEVFGHGGFDTVVGNPPFMGGLRLETAFGWPWRNHLVTELAGGARGVRGTADLCAYFMLRAGEIVREPGLIGFITTNSIAEGDTRLIGLDQLIKKGARVIRAVSSQKWPGSANLEIAMVWLRRGAWSAPCVLNGIDVAAITSRLSGNDESTVGPFRLRASAGRGFIGATILGTGFILDTNDAQRLIQADRKNADVLFPLLIGDDINSRPDQSPSRWVINFHNWPLERAERYADCITLLRALVKPERDKLIGRNPESTRRGQNWWLYAQDANRMFLAIRSLSRVLVKSIVSKHHIIAFVPTGFVPSHVVVLFAFEDFGHFAVLQSAIHEQWAAVHSSRLETRLRYTPATCFETFVFPEAIVSTAASGRQYHLLREGIAVERREGLTAVYNRFHDRGETSEDIVRLRMLHEEMDHAVATAYGWGDLDLGRGFHTTKEGDRCTLSIAARSAIIERLLGLNHQRYVEEVKAGLHEKGGTKTETRIARRAASRQPDLLA